MADPMNLSVTNVRHTQTVQYDPVSRQAQTVYQVSYMVGANGPFTDTYTKAMYTHANVIAGINAQVAHIRAVAAHAAGVT